MEGIRENRTIGKRMHMRHEAKVGPVTRLEEERHPCHEPEHGALVVGVCQPNCDEEGPRDDSHEVDPCFFAPQACVGVYQIGNDAPERSKGYIEEAEHGRPIAAAGLLKGGEVLDVVRAQDGVDGQLGAKGAEVAACLI